MNESRKQQFIQNTLFCICIALWILLISKVLIPATIPFWLGLAVAFALKPAALFFARILHVKRKGVAFSLLLLFYLMIGLLLWGLAVSLMTQASVFFEMLPEIFSDYIRPFFHQCTLSVNQLLSRFSPRTAQFCAEKANLMMQELSSNLSTFSTHLIAQATAAAGKIPFFFITVGFSVLCSVFISLDYSAVTSFLVSRLPPKGRKLFFECKEYLTVSLLGMVRAYFLLMCLTFAELWLGFFLLGIEHSCFFAFLFAFLDILPCIGVGLLLIPWAVCELLFDQWTLGLGLLILYAIISFVRNIMEPKIVGHCIGLPPLVTLVAMYAGLTLCGFWGLFLAPPLVLLIRFLYQNSPSSCDRN